MLEGVRAGSSMSELKKENEKKDSKYMRAAQNIVRYIEMPEGGHYMYGMNFLFCQVRLICTKIRLLRTK